MKRVLALCLLLCAPLSAAPAPAPPRWWEPPPEVNRALQVYMQGLADPFSQRSHPYREQRQFRDRKGLVWLTLVKVGDDVKEFNRDGLLICHGWVQGRQFVVWALSPDGHWHRAY